MTVTGLRRAKGVTAPNERPKLWRANKVSVKVLNLLYMEKTLRYNAKIATAMTLETLKGSRLYEK